MTAQMKKRLLFAAAFCVPAALYVVVMVAAKVTPFGGGSLLLWDASEQYAPFLAYWRGVFTGENDIFYSLSRGLGYSTAGLIGYYLADPLNLLLLLFPADNMPLAFSLLILLRIGLCGLTFFVFLRKIYDCGWIGLLFSTSYALMGMIAAYSFHFMWLIAFILLPLVALGVRRLVWEHKLFLFLAALGLTLLTQYYIGYMVCLFSALYFVAQLIRKSIEEPLGRGEGRRSFCRFISAALLAAGLATVVLVPVAFSLSEGYSQFDTSLLKLSLRFSLPDMLTKLYTGSMSITQARDGLPNIYIGIPLLAFLPFYFCSRRLDWRKRLVALGLALVFLASLQISVLYYAWHAFERPTYYAARFSFLVSFVLIELAWLGYRELDAFPPKRRKLVAILSAVVFGAMTVALFHQLSIDYLSYRTIAVDLGIFLVTCVLIALAVNTRRKKMFWLLLICAMQAVCLLLNVYYPIVRLREKDYITAVDYTAAMKRGARAVGRVRAFDGGVYRMEMNDQMTDDDPMIYGYAGITNSASDVNRTWMDFADKLGFQEISFRTKYENGTSPVVESVFGLKYVLKDQAVTHAEPPAGYEPLWTEDGITAYKNAYALPLAYLAPEQTLELASDNPFINQNTLLSDLTGGDVSVFEPMEEIGRAYDGTWETYTFPVAKDRPLYLWSWGTEYQWNGGGILAKNHFNGTVALPQASEDTTHTISMTYPLGIRLAYFDLEAFQEAQAVLAAHAAAVTSDTDSHLLITANVTDDHTQLLITVPYDGGWQAWVDGERAETTSRYGALLAVNLTQGAHTVELRFVPLGLWAGVGVSLLSLALTVLWAVFERRKRR